MPKGSCGSKSPAQQLLNKDHKLAGIPKQMGSPSGSDKKSDLGQDHAKSERDYKRTEVY